MTDDLAALAAFTAARLDEDEAGARKLADMLASARPGADLAICFDDGTSGTAFDYNPWDRIGDYDPARALREVAAKRALLAEAQNMLDNDMSDNPGARWLADDILRHLAAVWSDHPDYRKEWAS